MFFKHIAKCISTPLLNSLALSGYKAYEVGVLLTLQNHRKN